MVRSFQIVEDKIAEADFFIEMLKEASYKHGFFHARNFLSAFLSASRSITFVLKASISDIQGFEEWYSVHEKMLRDDPIARFFLEARNLSQKVGYYPINYGMHKNDNSGARYQEYRFDNVFYPGDSTVPETDVLSACKEHLTLLLTVVYDCYQVFGPLIDPDQYYTVENMRNQGKTVEDFEEEIGFPRGWTDGGSDEERVAAIRRQNSSECADPYLIKYLGKNRFGETIQGEQGSEF